MDPVTGRFFFFILDCYLHFYPLPTLTTQKTKLWKNEKTSWRYHFIHVYHKWQSFDVWFLRYWTRWTECFVILDHFFVHLPAPPHTPPPSPNNPKHPNFEKMNKMPGDRSAPSKLRFGSYFYHSLVNFENMIILFWKICVIYRVQIRKEKSLHKNFWSVKRQKHTSGEKISLVLQSINLKRLLIQRLCNTLVYIYYLLIKMRS